MRLARLTLPAVAVVIAACGHDSPTGPLPGHSGTTVRWRSVDAGFYNACGVTDAGKAYCWGLNPNGALGDGDSVTASVLPVAVEGGIDFASVSVGLGAAACGVDVGGVGYCWGYGVDGLLGDGRLASSAVPVPIAGGLRFAQISVGWDHACGLTVGGDAYCWGQNGGGQLGDGTTTTSAVPVRVALAAPVASIRAGGFQTCAVTGDGAGYCWGRDAYGEVGVSRAGCADVTQCSFATPQRVAPNLSFAEITAGNTFSCGVTTAGEGWCWGAVPLPDMVSLPHPYLLGAGAIDGSEVPVRVAGDHQFVHISAGSGVACGTTSTGTALCWGYNAWGALGLGGMDDNLHATPAAVRGRLVFETISVGDRVCGITNERVAYCWGEVYGRVDGGTIVVQGAYTVATPVPDPR